VSFKEIPIDIYQTFWRNKECISCFDS